MLNKDGARHSYLRTYKRLSSNLVSPSLILVISDIHCKMAILVPILATEE